MSSTIKSQKELLLIFVKNPIPGKVKTRLGKDLGYEAAATVYKKLMQLTRTVAAETNVNTRVYYGDYVNEADLWDGFEKHLQYGEDLGARMQHAFAEGYKDGYRKICIIGSDCPQLDEKTISAAFSALDNNDLVIGPALDGGYYLLGLSQQADVFSGKTWSTDTVLQETLDDAVRLGLKHFLLEPKTDLDTIDDLKKFPQYDTKA